jgi:hypothetical protein
MDRLLLLSGSAVLRRQGGLLGVTLAALFLFALGAALTVSRLEERDPFCAVCHLRPETTYVGRAAAAQGSRPVDLAAAHARAGLSCVACHRGDSSLPDRVRTLALGAWNAARTPFTPPDVPHHPVRLPGLLENSCRLCHVQEPARAGIPPGVTNPVMAEGFENHFHTDLFRPDLWTSVGCVDCHRAHVETVTPFFVVQEIVIPACKRCHQEASRGPTRMGP